MARRDYYEVLGVSRHATSLEIRRAYRRLAREYSPDVNVGAERGAALFEEITEAYRVLSDAAARSVYDGLGRGAVAAEEPADAARRGDDLHYPVELDLVGAIRGVPAILEVARRQRCPSCQGRPRAEATGRGRCPTCGGRGTLLGQARIPVDIPPGVDTGTEIRVPGEGHAAPGGGPRGDLVVITRLRPHPFFTRKGDNLSCEVPITIPEAVLGARIRVPTPDGPAVVTIPPGTQSGQVFRIRGHGCPRLHQEVRGDILVSTRVVIPRNAESTLEGVLRELERLLPENPRADLWRWEGTPR